MKIEVCTKDKVSPIYVEEDLLSHINEFIDKDEHAFVVSDSGVPTQYQEKLLSQLPNAILKVIPQGEQSKNINVFGELLEEMLKNHFTRDDVVIALGGGVVGDLSGFVAASYMRGIRFINIPTTTLSQIDSSIGGKTAIDLGGYKNSVGAFWQPEMVLIDPNVIQTLSPRHINNGLVEAIKEGLIKDKELFEIFEEDYENQYLTILEKCLNIKKEIVELDERESGPRKLLNFGHTVGHGLESYYGLDEMLHGECVAMGMVLILENEEIKERLIKVLDKLSIPTNKEFDAEKVFAYIEGDKKGKHDSIDIVQVHEIGNGVIENWPLEKVKEKLGL